jgi:alkylation response protein AidB-like acyl-CoA dehydrogenase
MVIVDTVRRTKSRTERGHAIDARRSNGASSERASTVFLAEAGDEMTEAPPAPVPATPVPPDDLRGFRTRLLAWLDENATTFEARCEGASLDDEVARTRRNQERLWDAGWLRYGWPAAVGGLGGPPILRAAVAEAAVIRQLVVDTVFAMNEVLGPTVIAVAPALAAEHAASFLRGSVGWCQGFSESEAGSDLASLRCRAVDDGDHWVVTGRKIWTSYAQFASKIVLLARTGSLESRHRGITAMLVDMDSPGLSVRPLHGINDQDEFSETTFDEVRVPKSRLVGEENGGWPVAMSILSSERGGIFWMLSARLLVEFRHLVATAEPGAPDDDAVGHAFTTLAALRARSWTTQHRLTAGTIELPETSIDKILMATSEQELYDLVKSLLHDHLAFDDTDAARVWRAGYMYSRAASIYGGTAEIQRNIVADQLIGLRGIR